MDYIIYLSNYLGEKTWLICLKTTVCKECYKILLDVCLSTKIAPSRNAHFVLVIIKTFKLRVNK